MEPLLFRLRLAVLWVFVGGGWVTAFVLNLMLPGVVEGLRQGELAGRPIGGAQLLLYAFLYVYPFTLAVLCLTLRGAALRWSNVLAGSVGAVIMVADLAMHAANLARGGTESAAIWIVMFVGVLVTGFVAVQAYRAPSAFVA